MKSKPISSHSYWAYWASFDWRANLPYSSMYHWNMEQSTFTGTYSWAWKCSHPHISKITTIAICEIFCSETTRYQTLYVIFPWCAPHPIDASFRMHLFTVRYILAVHYCMPPLLLCKENDDMLSTKQIHSDTSTKINTASVSIGNGEGWIIFLHLA